jgi:hypothetical protein
MIATFGKYTPAIRWAPVVLLTDPVDRGLVTYQRDTRQVPTTHGLDITPRMRERFTKRFGDTFVVERWTLPSVSKRRDGVLAVMDGNGRCHFAQYLNGPEFQVPYLEYVKLTLVEEIRFFNAQRYTKPLTADNYRVAMEQDPDSQESTEKKIVESYGFTIGPRKGQIRSGLIRGIVEEDGEASLPATLGVLRIVREMYPSDTDVTAAAYVRAVSRLLNTKGFSRERLVSALVSVTPSSLVEHAGQTISGDVRYRLTRLNIESLYVSVDSEISLR